MRKIDNNGSHLNDGVAPGENEGHFRASSERLEQQLEARTTELQHQAARLRWLTGELISAEQRERKRLAALLHDDLQHLLVAAKLRLGQVQKWTRDPEVLAAIEGVTDLLAEAVYSLRDLTRELRPPVLYEKGLLPGLQWLASELSRRHGLHVIIDAEEKEPPLSDEARALLFESVRELLFNVVKHADVKEATVRMHQDEQRLQLAIEDGGVGFNADAVTQERAQDPQPPGLGLFSIRERLAALGGSIALESVPGKGARIWLDLPFG